ncbi:MAG: nitrilase [Betaproteobacteria bacterium]|nr:nitrilase [Betaproteobacteria bacterium]
MNTTADSRIKPYTALALQTPCQAINRAPDTTTARRWMMDSIERIGRQIIASKRFIGPDVRLVVLPEYFASSYPAGESLPLWAERAAWAPDGPEYAAIGVIARTHGVYLSGNVYETDPYFPGLYFQTSFVTSDTGQIVLRYRRLVSMFAPTPHDVWDRYLAHHSLDAVFPVADTPLGRLACIASEEILYPEIARVLALKGAEVLLHSTSEVGSPRLTPKDVAKRARAYENMSWVVSANSAGITNLDFPTHSTDGMSKVVDFKGEVRAEAGFGESMVAHAEIDIEAVRRHRAKPGMANVLARQRLELFAAAYAGSVYPANNMLGPGGELQVPDRAHFMTMQSRAIEVLRARGVALES